jgi:hypothetical protein
MNDKIPIILAILGMILAIISLIGYAIACEELPQIPPTSTDNGSVYDPNNTTNIEIINIGGNECPPPNDTGITCGPIPENTVPMQPTR